MWMGFEAFLIILSDDNRIIQRGGWGMDLKIKSSGFLGKRRRRGIR